MDVAGRYEAVGYDAANSVHRPVIQVEKALGLAVADHVAAVGIGRADLDFLGFRSRIARRQGLFAVPLPEPRICL